MEPLEQKVSRFIRDNDLFAGAGRILLAVSGGADSIALLHVMHRLTCMRETAADLLCAHLNHGLRGAAGDGDEAFVARQARELGRPFVARAIDVGTYARQHRLSIETAARQLRLGKLCEIARAEGCSSIAMGHQKDDNAETLIQRLERGTGLRGLAGIRPSRPAGEALTFVRPLLCCSRAEIVEYLRARNLTWREDHTNADCVYRRNRIRHRLLPALQSASDGSLVEQLASLAISAGRLHARVAWEAEDAAERHARSHTDGTAIDAAALAGLPEPVAVELLRQRLSKLGLGERDLTRRHYRDLLHLAAPQGEGKTMSLPDGFSAHRESTAIVLRRPTSQSQSQKLPDAVELRIPGTTPFGRFCIDAQVLDAAQVPPAAISQRRNSFLEYLDFDRIRPPLIVRARRNGDRFVPLGQHGERKLGKFLTAAKVPDAIRSRTLIVEDAQGILWVCPVRIGDRAKVTEKTSILLDLRVTRR